MRFLFIILGIILISVSAVGWGIYNKMARLCIRFSSEKYIKRREKYDNYLKTCYNAQPVLILTEDNFKLAGLLIERPQAKRVIAIFHGYRQAKEFMYSWVDLFKDDTIVLVDFRAHGHSMGDIVSFGFDESKDVKAVAQFLKTNNKTKNLPLYAIGVSMGSVALLKAVQEGAEFKAIILDSGFSCLETQLKFSFSKRSGLPERLFFIARLLFEWHIPGCLSTVKPYQLIRQIDTPVFIIHSKADRVVPVECAIQLYNNAAKFKKLWIVENAEHIHIHKFFPQEYKHKALDFFDASR